MPSGNNGDCTGLRTQEADPLRPLATLSWSQRSLEPLQKKIILINKERGKKLPGLL